VRKFGIGMLPTTTSDSKSTGKSLSSTHSELKPKNLITQRSTNKLISQKPSPYNSSQSKLLGAPATDEGNNDFFMQ